MSPRTTRPSSAASATLVLTLLSGALAGTTPAQAWSTLGNISAGIATAGDRTGFSVAILGDVNADGTDDLLIGAPHDDDNGTDSGTIYVVNGFPQTLLYEKHGSAAGDLFGYAVANLGDMTGDGIDDFIVGAPGTDFNGSDRGGISVFSGASGLIQYSALGPKAGSFFGGAVAGGGDLNNDGLGDFLVGASSWDIAGPNTNQGWFGVYSGAAGNQVKAVSGSTASAQLGFVVAFVGDLDADGHVDYAVGSPTFDYVDIDPIPQSLVDAGRVSVYSGIDHDLIYATAGKSNGELLGTSIARAGDTDGDGVPELIAGAPGHSANRGTAFLHEGAVGTQIHQFLGSNLSPADRFGAAVGPLGDVNHDGRDDVLVGAPLLFATVGLGGYVAAFTGGDYAPFGSALTSPDTGDGLGSVISASSGDLSGDGWNDVLVGVPNNDLAGAESGSARSCTLTYNQVNLLFQGPGSSALSMYGTQLDLGGSADLALVDSKPNAPAYLFASPVPLFAPFKGGVLVPSATPALILPFVTDAQGEVHLDGIPGGGGPLTLYMQFLIQDASQPQGWQLSNGIAASFLP